MKMTDYAETDANRILMVPVQDSATLRMSSNAQSKNGRKRIGEKTVDFKGAVKLTIYSSSSPIITAFL